MAINLQSTSDVATTGVKILCYGAAGAGKTTLIKTLPKPVIISAESGLLSLKGESIPYIEIGTMDDLQKAYAWASESKDASKFKSIAIDSISEIAEVVLAHEKSNSKDPRQAYGAMIDQVGSIVRSFRDLPGKHVYMSAKLDKVSDETGRLLYGPSMPGKQLPQQLPYFFDEVFALRIEHDEDGDAYRAIQTDGDGRWLAKDRSGALDMWESPDLGAIIKKIGKR